MNIAQPGVPSSPSPVVTAGTFSIPASPNTYVFSGAATTWTLPGIPGSTGINIVVKNRGTGMLTVQGLVASSVWDTAIVTSVAVPIGGSATFINDGTYWNRR